MMFQWDGSHCFYIVKYCMPCANPPPFFTFAPVSSLARLAVVPQPMSEEILNALWGMARVLKIAGLGDRVEESVAGLTN